jgi:hypothetical protein
MSMPRPRPPQYTSRNIELGALLLNPAKALGDEKKKSDHRTELTQRASFRDRLFL